MRDEGQYGIDTITATDAETCNSQLLIGAGKQAFQVN